MIVDAALNKQMKQLSIVQTCWLPLWTFHKISIEIPSLILCRIFSLLKNALISRSKQCELHNRLDYELHIYIAWQDVSKRSREGVKGTDYPKKQTRNMED